MDWGVGGCLLVYSSGLVGLAFISAAGTVPALGLLSHSAAHAAQGQGPPDLGVPAPCLLLCPPQVSRYSSEVLLGAEHRAQGHQSWSFARLCGVITLKEKVLMPRSRRLLINSGNDPVSVTCVHSSMGIDCASPQVSVP